MGLTMDEYNARQEAEAAFIRQQAGEADADAADRVVEMVQLTRSLTDDDDYIVPFMSDLTGGRLIMLKLRDGVYQGCGLRWVDGELVES